MGRFTDAFDDSALTANPDEQLVVNPPTLTQVTPATMPAPATTPEMSVAPSASQGTRPPVVPANDPAAPVNETPPAPRRFMELFEGTDLPSSASQGQASSAKTEQIMADSLVSFKEKAERNKAYVEKIFDGTIESYGNVFTPTLADVEHMANETVGAMRAFAGHVLFFEKGAVQTGNHVVQIGADSLAFAGILNEDQVNEMAGWSREKMEQLNHQLVMKFGDAPQFGWSETVGEIMVPVLGWEASLLRTAVGAQWLTRIMEWGRAGGLGAFGSMAMQDTEQAFDDSLAARMAARADPAIQGAAAGFGVGVATVFLNTLRGMFSKGVAHELDDIEAIKAQELESWFQDRLGDSSPQFHIQQIFDSPWIDAVATSAAGTVTVAKAARNLKRSQRDNAVTLLDNVIKEIGTGAGLGTRAKNAIDNGVDLLDANRKSNAKANFATVRADVTPYIYENAPMVGTKAVRDLLDKEMTDNALTNITSKANQRKVDALSETLDSVSDHMSLFELEKQLTKWGKAAFKGNDQWKDLLSPSESAELSKKIWMALKQDMDAAIQSGIPGAGNLKHARDTYKVDSDALKAVKDTAIGKFYGDLGVKNGSDLEREIVNLAKNNLEGLEESLKFLEKYQPGVREDLQSFWLQRFLTKSKTNQVSRESALDPDKFLEIVKGDNEPIFQALFPNKGEQDIVRKSLEVMRHLNRKFAGGSTGGWPAKAKAAAGILVSGDLTFGARFAADMFTPRAFSRYASSAEGLEALKILMTDYNTARWSWAIGVLSEASGIRPFTREQVDLDRLSSELTGNPNEASLNAKEDRINAIQNTIPLGVGQ